MNNNTRDWLTYACFRLFLIAILVAGVLEVVTLFALLAAAFAALLGVALNLLVGAPIAPLMTSCSAALGMAARCFGRSIVVTLFGAVALTVSLVLEA